MKFETRLNPWGQLYLPKKLCKTLGTELVLYPQRNVLVVIGKNADVDKVLRELNILRLEIELSKEDVSV